MSRDYKYRENERACFITVAIKTTPILTLKFNYEKLQNVISYSNLIIFTIL